MSSLGGLDSSREPLAQPVDRRQRLVDRQRRLRQPDHLLGVAHLHVGDVLGAVDQLDALRRLAGRALDLLVPAVADEQDVVVLASAKRRASVCTLVTSGQVASIVRRLRRAASSCTAGETPCALKTTTAPSGTSSVSSTKIAPAALQRGDDVLVVHDLLADVHRRTVELQRLLHGDHRAVDARAVPPRVGEQDASALISHAPIVGGAPPALPPARGVATGHQPRRPVGCITPGPVCRGAPSWGTLSPCPVRSPRPSAPPPGWPPPSSTRPAGCPRPCPGCPCASSGWRCRCR